MKKYFIVIFAVLLLLFSCDNKRQVSLLKVEEIESSFQSDIKKYVLNGTCAGTYIRKESTVPTFTVLLTESGLWNMYVEAYGVDGDLIAKSDLQDIEILPDKDNEARFQIKPILENRVCSLKVNIAKEGTESSLSDKSKSAIKKYVFNGKLGETYIKKESTVPTFTVLLTESGLWNVYIEAYGAEGSLIAKSDSQDIEMVPYKKTEESFLLKEEKGTFNFKLGIPKDVTTMDKILCTLSNTEEISEEIKFEFDFKTDGSIDGDYSIFTKELSLSVASYNLKVETTNILENVYGDTINKTVDILWSQRTDFEHIWDMSYFPQDSASITVNNGSEYFPGYLYISKSSEDVSIYCSFDNGEYSDITNRIVQNKVDYANAKYSTVKIIASSDLSKWTRGNPCFELKSTGPAGGVVFYDCDADNEYSNNDGLISSECKWRYLEAAPEDLSEKYIFGYSSMDIDSYLQTSTQMGKGKENTDSLVALMGTKAITSLSNVSYTELYATRMASIYSYNDFTDWFLPSIGELYQMWEAKNHIGNFSTDYSYWSSTIFQYDKAWSKNFNDKDDKSDEIDCDTLCYVRPIRAFSD